jgi:hypothetical protein
MPAEAVGAAVFIETISQNGVAQTRTEGGFLGNAKFGIRKTEKILSELSVSAVESRRGSEKPSHRGAGHKDGQGKV